MLCIFLNTVHFCFLRFLGDENDVEEIKHLEPHEMKAHMKTILENMDKNKNGLIEKQELSDKLLETYR